MKFTTIKCDDCKKDCRVEHNGAEHLTSLSHGHICPKCEQQIFEDYRDHVDEMRLEEGLPIF